MPVHCVCAEKKKTNLKRGWLICCILSLLQMHDFVLFSHVSLNCIFSTSEKIDFNLFWEVGSNYYFFFFLTKRSQSQHTCTLAYTCLYACSWCVNINGCLFILVLFSCRRKMMMMTITTNSSLRLFAIFSCFTQKKKDKNSGTQFSWR